jgi:hypothetical protein
VTEGYWQINYWPEIYWVSDYWPTYSLVPSTVGMEFLSLLSPARVTLSTYSPVRASVELLSLVDATAEGDSQS